MLLSDPGEGKTEIIGQMVQALKDGIFKTLNKDFKLGYKQFCATQHLPEDVGGIAVPDYEKGEVNMLPLSFVKSLSELKYGVLFVDELLSASLDVGAALQSVVSDHRFGPHRLAPGIAIVLASNPVESGTNSRPMSAAEASRVVHIPWSLDFDDFCDHMEDGKGAVRDLPIVQPDWKDMYYRRVWGLVKTYLRSSSRGVDGAPASFRNLPEPHEHHKAWPNPRTWKLCTLGLAAAWSAGYDPITDVGAMIADGLLGKAVGKELRVFIQKMDLPDPEEVLRDPDSYDAPLRPDRLMVFLDSVASVATQANHPNFKERWETAAHKIIGPVLATKEDCALSAASLLFKNVPPGAKFPTELKALHIARKNAGLVETRAFGG
tara:strand:- start:4434 stop:5564 length:1131 start_codon:yes stop_codon:yes gene_type:complete